MPGDPGKSINHMEVFRYTAGDFTGCGIGFLSFIIH